MFCIGCHNDLTRGWQTIPQFYRDRVKKGEGQDVSFTADKPFVTLLGVAGIGKTITATKLVSSVYRELAVIPAFINCAELMMQIRSTFREHARETEEEIVQRVAAVGLLILDDLASEKVSDYSISTLYIILNRRGERSKPTIITTNLKMPEIAAQLGDRIANRLARYGETFTLE